MQTQAPAVAPQQTGGFQAAIQLSASNVRDFIRAKGIGIPIVIPPGDLKAFILDVARSWSFNITKLPKGLMASCARAGAEAAEAAIRKIIPGDLDPEKKLPRYLDQHAMRAGAEAAESVIRPWVLGGAHHTNPNRQESGRKAANKALVLNTWKETACVKTISPDDSGRSAWICADVGVVLDSVSQFKAALAQNLLATGETELEACRIYADANNIGWPDSLKADDDS